MSRTPTIAAIALALMSTTALANPVGSTSQAANTSAPTGQPITSSSLSNTNSDGSRDLFCRGDAAARTGYTSPDQAARDEQAKGTIGGALGGAALGALVGADAGNAGLGAAAGAGAGLIAGTAIGADNAQHAAINIKNAYAAAYYNCMHEDNQQTAYDGPILPVDGYPYPPPPYYYYYGPYPYYPYFYGPPVTVGFGWGPHWHRWRR